jgi:hypothetical protein
MERLTEGMPGCDRRATMVKRCVYGLRSIWLPFLVTLGTATVASAQSSPIVDVRPVVALDASGSATERVVGSGCITRDDTGITVEITTSGLTPLNVYTVWWMIFRPDGGPLYVGNASGGIALPNGAASFSAHLPVGPLPIVDGKSVLVAESPRRLSDTGNVRVTVVIREHGPVIVDRLAEQLTMVEGGCSASGCKNVQGLFEVH